jgi:hypothetical protein
MLVTLRLAQAALLKWHIALGDPHIHKQDDLINRCRPNQWPLFPPGRHAR